MMHKDIEKNIDKIIIAIVVLVIRYIRGFNKYKSPKTRPDTNQPNEERTKNTDHFPFPPAHVQPQPKPIEPAITTRRLFQPRLNHVSNSMQRQLMRTPSYPGIKKLVLPTQEQDPYQFYQATYPQKQQQLFQLLKKYNPTQQLIIMHEILAPKT